MRFATKKGLNVLGQNFMIIPWIGVAVGLLLCSSFVLLDGLAVPLQQLHLSVYGVPTTGKVYEMNAEARDMYYVNCRFKIQKLDGSTEFVSRTRTIPDDLYYGLRIGDEVRIVYSSKYPNIWMLEDHLDKLSATIAMSCFGLILIFAGFGAILLLRPKK